ncbi:hypothetical protein C474_10956 [Halogeometricum pallidum JCM 14848]|uniref:Uncharacterized protein n=1 Tax=Halogeometricum pallidum JCM 14848 TaxID=1227487 RepID=M0D658_HALPD|nr:hypothetical protein [Halogeometricum pallidum]ELZ30976.1 hypothetical protein C474_10956 [Halogeometricum pallidum JCM 14848]
MAGDQLPDPHRRTSTSMASASRLAFLAANAVFSGYRCPNPRWAMTPITDNEGTGRKKACG